MLEEEIKIFDAKLGEFLTTHENQFVLIKAKTIEFFPTEDEAVEYGLHQFGVAAHFLVRKVTGEQPKVDIPALAMGLPFAG